MFTVSNHHVSGEEPPEIDGDDPNTYHSYFEKRYGEQSLFVFRRDSKEATLYSGDAGWTAFPVVDGQVTGLVLAPEEAIWLSACMMGVAEKSLLSPAEVASNLEVELSQLQQWERGLVIVEKEPNNCGMGFITDFGEIITAAHCLPRLPDPADLGFDPIAVTVRTLDGKFETTWLVQYADVVGDVALLTQQTVFSKRLSDRKREEAERLIESGYGLPIRRRNPEFDAQENVWLYTVDRRWIQARLHTLGLLPHHEMEAPEEVKSGTSGSPVLSASGEVIGIITSSNEMPTPIGCKATMACLATTLPVWCLANGKWWG